jgi:hypothetical protein
MKICVVSLCTKELDYMENAILNKQYYCKKYNYKLINFTERLSKRHCPWDKIQCLLKTLNWFDYVMWIDADAIFNNLSISIENIINEHNDKDLLICKDPCYNPEACLTINAGVMIFKNTVTSVKLLNDVWDNCSYHSIDILKKNSYDGWPYEQGSLTEMLKKEEYSNCYHLYEQTKFNAHPCCSNSDTFIIHYMGSRQSEDDINNFVSNVERINNINNITSSEEKICNSLNLKYKLALTTMYTENIKSYGELSTKNKKWYTTKYDIDLIVTKDRLSNRHPAWDKIKCVINAMQENYDYIIWMDADAIFLTDKIDFNNIINIYSDKNFIVCLDPFTSKNELDINADYKSLENLRIINTGVFIIKNNDEMKELINNAWNTQTNTNNGFYDLNKSVDNFYCWNDWPFEQGALTLLLAGRDDIAILSQKAFNTLTGTANENTFILHDMGGRININKITELFTEWNEKLNVNQDAINVVVSRFNKNVDFLKSLEKYDTNIMVYDKENNNNPYNVPINRGHEASVYLKYIIDNYYKLTNYTFFIHDEDYSWHHNGSIEERFLEATSLNKLFYNINHFNLGPYEHINIHDQKELTEWYSKFVEPYIPFEKLPNKDWLVGYKGCSQFLVHKSVIMHLPHKFYNDIYNWILEYNNSKLAGHFLEWTWHIFWDISPTYKIYNEPDIMV